MATNLPRKRITFPAIAALGLAVFGALQYKKSQKNQAKVDGDTASRLNATAADIDVGTTPGATASS